MQPYIDHNNQQQLLYLELGRSWRFIATTEPRIAIY